MEEGFKIATELAYLFKLYARKNDAYTSLTELIIHFSLGVSSFMAGFEEKAVFFFDRILQSSGFIGIKEQFCAFVGQYARTTADVCLRTLLMDNFSA